MEYLFDPERPKGSHTFFDDLSVYDPNDLRATQTWLDTVDQGIPDGSAHARYASNEMIATQQRIVRAITGADPDETGNWDLVRQFTDEYYEQWPRVAYQQGMVVNNPDIDFGDRASAALFLLGRFDAPARIHPFLKPITSEISDLQSRFGGLLYSGYGTSAVIAPDATLRLRVERPTKRDDAPRLVRNLVDGHELILPTKTFQNIKLGYSVEIESMFGQAVLDDDLQVTKVIGLNLVREIEGDRSPIDIVGQFDPRKIRAALLRSPQTRATFEQHIMGDIDVSSLFAPAVMPVEFVTQPEVDSVFEPHGDPRLDSRLQSIAITLGRSGFFGAERSHLASRQAVYVLDELSTALQFLKQRSALMRSRQLSQIEYGFWFPGEAGPVFQGLPDSIKRQLSQGDDLLQWMRETPFRSYHFPHTHGDRSKGAHYREMKNEAVLRHAAQTILDPSRTRSSFSGAAFADVMKAFTPRGFERFAWVVGYNDGPRLGLEHQHDFDVVIRDGETIDFKEDGRTARW